MKMKKINRIEVCFAEGTGAGYGQPAHLYAQGIGVVWARSIKNGLAQATKLANARLYKNWIELGVSCGCAIPVYDHIKINGEQI